ncbi:MAG TPA: glycine cleavage system aminomethyltransferase GcvT [Geminicoccaceae bacterium]|nr:glycine cleavage system aminomethyltransferase GcvT [Geminicoccaceae bacterium]
MSNTTAPSTETAPRRTPLHDLHVELGGKLVDFAGWSLPVQYPSAIMAEHRHCRTAAALFDVSHMCQARIRGAGVAQAFERLVPGDVARLSEGELRYTVFTNEQGGVLDDLIVGRVDEGLFVVANAARRDVDLAHMRQALEPQHRVEEIDDRGLLAVQGPRAEDVLGRLCPAARALAFMQTTTATVAGVPCRVSRCGYTGEDGFEISVAATDAPALARRLLEEPEVAPAGLGARDSLRLEAALCLYGHELTSETTPVEAGLRWTIAKSRRSAGDFPGAPIILRQLQDGPERRLVGIRPEGRAPAREGTVIEDRGGECIGEVTSGGFGPTVGGPIALGYVRAQHAAPGTPLQLSIRGKPHPAKVVGLPFVPHRYKR